MSTFNIFFVEKYETYQYFWVIKANYLKLCFAFNIKTIPLSRPLSAALKVVFIAEFCFIYTSLSCICELLVRIRNCAYAYAYAHIDLIYF